jgi:hypothetical protein
MAEFSAAERIRESNEKRLLVQQINDYNGRLANQPLPVCDMLGEFFEKKSVESQLPE